MEREEKEPATINDQEFEPNEEAGTCSEFEINKINQKREVLKNIIVKMLVKINRNPGNKTDVKP